MIPYQITTDFPAEYEIREEAKEHGIKITRFVFAYSEDAEKKIVLRKYRLPFWLLISLAAGVLRLA